MTTKTMTRISYRRMIASDLVPVMLIEQQSFLSPWSAGEFHAARRGAWGANAFVAVDQWQRVMGYVVWNRDDDELVIKNLAVAPHCRRRGVGRFLVDRVKPRATNGRRVRVMVWERNVDGCKFFASGSVGFRTAGLVRDAYDENEDDGILFEWREAR